MQAVTQLLNNLEQGDPSAASELLPLVYDELRRLAAQKLASEPAGQTLQPTGLVHEAYLRLVGGETDPHWQGRRHFFAAAAEAMRRILVENARRKRSHKRGGGRQRLRIDELQVAAPEVDEMLLAIDEALGKLAAKDPVKAELVKLRYFGGCTMAEAADALGISKPTAERYWAYARAWLHQEVTTGNLLTDGDAPSQKSD